MYPLVKVVAGAF